MTQQKSTNVNKTIVEYHDYYEELKTKKHRLAVDMKLQGFGYRDIARNKEINVAHQTARLWFSRGGICYEAYRQELRLIKEDRDKRFKEISNRLKNLGVDAIVVLEGVMKDKNTKLEKKGDLAIKVLELNGFAAEQKIKHSNDPDNPINQSVIITLPNNERPNSEHSKT